MLYIFELILAFIHSGHNFLFELIHLIFSPLSMLLGVPRLREPFFNRLVFLLLEKLFELLVWLRGQVALEVFNVSVINQFFNLNNDRGRNSIVVGDLDAHLIS